LKILVTTAHSPSQRTRTFVKDLVSVLPNAEKITRGKMSKEVLASIATDMGAERLLIIREKNGNPASIEVYKVEDVELIPLGKIVIRGISLSSEVGRRSYGVSKVCLNATPLTEEDEKVIRNLKEMLGLEECEDGDLVAVLEKDERGYTLYFVPPDSKLKVGPVVRLKSVEFEGESGDSAA